MQTETVKINEPVEITRKDIENYVKMKFYTELTLIKEKLALFEKNTTVISFNLKNRLMKQKRKISNVGMTIWNGRPFIKNTIG